MGEEKKKTLPAFFYNIKQKLVDTILPGQDTNAFLKGSLPYVDYRDACINPQFNPEDPLYDPTPTRSNSALGFDTDPASVNFAQDISTHFSHVRETDENRPFIDETINKLITHRQSIADSKDKNDKALKQKQLYMMNLLKIGTPPSEEMVQRFFDPNSTPQDRTEVLKIAYVHHLKQSACEKINPTKSDNTDSIPDPLATLPPQKPIHHANLAIDGQPTLDAMKFSPDGSFTPPVIVAHFGNADCYEAHIEELAELARKNNCTVIGFNVRGFGLSSGKVTDSTQEAVDDAKRVLEHLTTRGC